MIEVALVFDEYGKTIHWHEPSGAQSGAIPDTRDLWEVLWENRDRLGGVAHTHPWVGPAHPSHTDLTTFAAVESGLGMHLLWPVVTFNKMIVVVRNPLYGRDQITHMWTVAGPMNFEIEDLHELRVRSGLQQIEAVP